MSRPLFSLTSTPALLAVDYERAADPQALLADPSVLAAFGFGGGAPQSDDPRYLRVPLEPHGGGVQAPFEVWRANAPVHSGRDGDIAWATDGELLFGAIEVDEAAIGITAAARHAYAHAAAFLQASRTPHLLRIWNYLDAITQGEGDAERYREFCVGRAQGLGDFDVTRLPAATAIGRCDDQRVVQVYWLAARTPGTPVENPRQVSAYRYPRQYGPQSPSFARAMLPPTDRMPLLLSGTAAVVGHASQHTGELRAQLEETFRNFDALIGAARAHRPELPARFGPSTRLKVYVRDAHDLPQVERALDLRFGDAVPRILLHAAICRRELAVEIDGVHGA
jgi:chorismate lyase/3-hydroxybenzoate synthase